MSQRSEFSPDTLPVDLTDAGIVVEYTDGREVFYGGVPETVTGELTTAPGKEVHVLVTDPTETEGVLVYVNDRTTADSIIADTGVGRVLLDQDEETTLFPGVSVRETGYRTIVDADPQSARGRVFVFEEDDMGERAFEIVAED
ncbi:MULTISPECIES: DUF5796 family protein [Halococcus]|uniref:Uncharacterized protein n=1 Tax=Halococcus salifodinae DSM 8989 TaxID=1227456 RepID=M0N9Q2_9EURY|nr:MULTISPECIES: DUF5796 family protein [Halococcus]EMA53380.1 hypothetical protein C450_08707 [Halococcus salifodinae DSM 8989]